MSSHLYQRLFFTQWRVLLWYVVNTLMPSSTAIPAFSLTPTPIYGSDWVQDYLNLDGKPFSLEHFPFMRDIYDQDSPSLLLKTCRQVGKSTTLANLLIMNSCLRMYWKQLFIAPTQEQTQRFSQSRYSRVLALSPRLKGRWTAQDETSRVFYKSFKNGSECVLSYASTNADRVRGVTAQEVFYDEIQDIDYDAVIPVISEVQSSFDVAYERFCGTPKTMENTIERLWQESTQTEWAVSCGGCGKFSLLLDERCIGKNGPICRACGKYLDVRRGIWVDGQTFDEDHRGKRVKGFHVSQPMIPLNVPASMPNDEKSQTIALGRWRRILMKLETYPLAKFKNEVMGVSDSLGARLITEEELLAYCTDRAITEAPMSNKTYEAVVAGVDWSGGGTAGNSLTVLYIWGVNRGSGIHKMTLDTLYFKIYDETNAISGGIVQDIITKCRHYDVNLVLGDAGGGALANNYLMTALGGAAQQVQYAATVSGTGGRPSFYWNKLDRYIAERTTMIDHFLIYVKNGGARFATPKHMEEVFRHVLSVYEDMSPRGQKIWRRTAGTPDDGLHAMIYGWMAANLVMNNPLFTTEIV